MQFFVKIASLVEYILIVNVITLHLCTSAPPKDKIFILGGVFDSDKTDDLNLQAFRHAVERSNIEPWFRPQTRLSWQAVSVLKGDSFAANKRLCSMLKDGVNAVVGPLSAKTSWQVQSTCSALQIPHISLYEDFRSRKNESGVSIYPQPQAIAKAVVATIREWEWFREFAILYESNEGLIRVQELLKLRDKEFTIHRLYPEEDPRPLLKAIRNSGVTRMVIDASIDRIKNLFEQFKYLDMLTEYYEYFIINLDFHTLDFRSYRSPPINITGFQILDPTNEQYRDIFSRWRLLTDKSSNFANRELDSPEQSLTTRMALIYDAVLLYASAISLIDRGREINITTHTCDMYGKKNKLGLKFINSIKKLNVTGITGPVFFDKYGLRSNLNIHLITNTHDRLLKVSTWNSNSGLINHFNRSELSKIMKEHLGEVKNLTVTTFENPPLFMKKVNPVEGEFPYEGYVVDLVEEIAKIVKRNFTIRPVLDHAYGSNKTGEWNGMVGELIRKKADLCVADLAITQARQDVVDFTIPFMNLGIGILFKKEKKKDHNLFSFLDPFSEDVWIYVGTASIAVSILLFILARFSPYEWDSPHPLDPDPVEFETQFNLMNSFWCIIAALIKHGCSFLPKALSTRTLTSIWWFLVLIMVATYTANLAAFLTASQMTSPIKSVVDLSKQFKIKYGCVKGGATSEFFRKSHNPVYQTMSRMMESADPSVFVNDNTEGIKRVLRGEYAFFMESVFIEYQTEKNCDLTPIGENLDSKGYGVGLPKGSPYFPEMNGAVLKLQDTGVLLKLKKRWWQDKTESVPCPVEPSGADSAKLRIENVGGVFLLVFLGICVAIIAGFIEFIWYTHKNVKSHKVNIWKEVKRELKFVFSFKNNTKPVRKSSFESTNTFAMTSY